MIELKPRKFKKRYRRAEKVNELIRTIATCGRRFLSYCDNIGRMSVDEIGRIWYRDAYTKKQIYMHVQYLGSNRDFTEGGTMWDLLKAFKGYIMNEEKLPPKAFGPWPDFICRGDPWGYGEDMQKIRDKAAELGLI